MTDPKSSVPIPITLLDGKLVCKQCGLPMRTRTLGDEFEYVEFKYANDPSEMKTLIGYSSPLGHDHDDNCWTRDYICPNGHKMRIGKRRHCPVCDWAGKESCFCHDGLKVEEFPND